MAGPWEDYKPAAESGPWNDYAAPKKRFGTGKSFDSINGELVPSESVVYTGGGVVPASSRVGQDTLANGTNPGFDFKIAKRDVQDLKGGIAAPVRGGIDALNALPVMAQDAGVGLRNVLTGSNYELPSQMYERQLNGVLHVPDVPGAQAVRFGTSLLSGAKLPVPQVNNPAPANFVSPTTNVIREQTLRNAQGAGYVVPPSTTNPTAGNKFLESIGGKIATAQDAAARNQQITNALAKRALGLSEDAPLSQGALTALRKEAGESYEVLRKVGAVTIDDATNKTLDGISARFAGSKLKEAIGGGNKIPTVIQAIKDEPLNGDTAVDVIALLRNEADKAYRAGDNMVGKGYKELSSTIENMMEKKLSGNALKAFRDARQLIAKSHSVEGALNESTGNVSAQKLATQLAKKKPLSGPLRDIASFGRAFPRAAVEVNDSGSVRNTDVVLGTVTSALSKEPWWLGYPFLRQGARAYMLSDAGQQAAVPGQFNGLPPEVLQALIMGGNAAKR